VLLELIGLRLQAHAAAPRSILGTPVHDLPWLADSNIAPMLAAFEKIMAGLGWERVVPVIGKEAGGTKVYDLLPDQVFTLADETEAARRSRTPICGRSMWGPARFNRGPSALRRPI
jgi:hypothetical protein